MSCFRISGHIFTACLLLDQIKSNLVIIGNQQLQRFGCWHAKCLEKMPFWKLGLNCILQNQPLLPAFESLLSLSFSVCNVEEDACCYLCSKSNELSSYYRFCIQKKVCTNILYPVIDNFIPQVQKKCQHSRWWYPLVASAERQGC